jgi:hypothetical protein
MATTVTLLMFSGRRDPTWELPPAETAELARKLVGYRSALDLSRLGYRGFRVQSDEPELPPEVIVRDAAELERFLLETAKSRVAPEIVDAVEAAIGP